MNGHVLLTEVEDNGTNLARPKIEFPRRIIHSFLDADEQKQPVTIPVRKFADVYVVQTYHQLGFELGSQAW